MISELIQGAGAIYGIMNNAGADARQYDQQKRLQGLQIEGNKEMTDYSRESQKKLWDETNTEAQMRHYKDAGVNPALMYGGSGAGGSTGSGGGMGVTGGQAADAAQTQSANTQQAGTIGQIGLMLAQAQLATAQKEKTTTEIPKVKAETENITQDTENKGLTAEYQEIQNKIANATKANQIEIVNAELINLEKKTDLLIEQKEGQDIDNNIKSTAKQDIIKQYNATLQKTLADTIAAQTGASLDRAKINEISNSIMQKWQSLNLEKANIGAQHTDRQAAIKEFTENALKVAGIQAAGQIINNAVSIATKQKPTLNRSTETTTHHANGNVTEQYQRTNNW